MINIKIDNKKLIKKITLIGHADFAKPGKDIVCAGVSAIVEGTINAIESITHVAPEFILEEGKSEICFSDDKVSQTIAWTMIYQLKTIAESYPKNVKIKYA